MKQTIEHVTKTALKFNNKKDFRKYATAEWSAAYRFNKTVPNFVNNICSHMLTEKELREKYRVYTKPILLKEAKKYKTRNDFRTKSPQHYKALLKMDKKEKGLMDRACSHMKSYTEIRKTPLKVFKEKALECNTKTEFRNKYPSLYKRALQISRTTKRKNFMKQICSHMKDLIIEREHDFTKNEFIPNIRKLLRKHKIKFKIHREYLLDDKSRIDVLIEIKGKETYFIPVEVKHDYSEWTKNQIQLQIRKYNKYFQNHKNTTKTYLISPKGKYGESMDIFFKKLDSAIKNKHKIEKPIYVGNPNKFKN
jgi:hypothetical protein